MTGKEGTELVSRSKVLIQTLFLWLCDLPAFRKLYPLSKFQSLHLQQEKVIWKWEDGMNRMAQLRNEKWNRRFAAPLQTKAKGLQTCCSLESLGKFLYTCPVPKSSLQQVSFKCSGRSFSVLFKGSLSNVVCNQRLKQNKTTPHTHTHTHKKYIKPKKPVEKGNTA